MSKVIKSCLALEQQKETRSEFPPSDLSALTFLSPLSFNWAINYVPRFVWHFVKVIRGLQPFRGTAIKHINLAERSLSPAFVLNGVKKSRIGVNLLNGLLIRRLRPILAHCTPKNGADRVFRIIWLRLKKLCNPSLKMVNHILLQVLRNRDG